MQTIGVIGAGQMGSGIAQTIAQHGLKVLLTDFVSGTKKAGRSSSVTLL